MKVILETERFITITISLFAFISSASWSSSNQHLPTCYTVVIISFKSYIFLWLAASAGDLYQGLVARAQDIRKNHFAVDGDIKMYSGSNGWTCFWFFIFTFSCLKLNCFLIYGIYEKLISFSICKTFFICS